MQNILSVSDEYCKCLMWMLNMFHTYVASLYSCCSSYFSCMLQQVLTCFRCFIHVPSVYSWMGWLESVVCIHRRGVRAHGASAGSGGGHGRSPCACGHVKRSRLGWSLVRVGVYERISGDVAFPAGTHDRRRGCPDRG